jgi:hypothetical protein
MVKAGKWKISTEEFEQQYVAATQQGVMETLTEPQARLAYYEAATHRLVVELKNGLILLVPCALLEGLAEARPEDIAKLELLPRGATLHWPTLDVQLSVAGLLQGIFGTKAWMAQLHQAELA